MSHASRRSVATNCSCCWWCCHHSCHTAWWTSLPVGTAGEEKLYRNLSIEVTYNLWQHRIVFENTSHNCNSRKVPHQIHACRAAAKNFEIKLQCISCCIELARRRAHPNPAPQYSDTFRNVPIPEFTPMRINAPPHLMHASCQKNVLNNLYQTLLQLSTHTTST